MTDIRRYTPTQRFQPTLAISPDGTTIAYSANSTGSYEVWLQPVGGGAARQLTHLGRTVRSIAWSPAGDRLAWAADRQGDEQYQIYLGSRTGSEHHRITTADNRQFHLPSTPFSADGTLLCYGGNDRDEGVQDIIVCDLSGGPTRRVDGRSGVLLQPTGISPDGRWLAVAGQRTNTSTDCCLVDLTEPNPTLRTVTPAGSELINHPGPWAADSSGFLLLTNADGEFLNVGFHAVEPATTTIVDAPGWDTEDIVRSGDGTTTAWTVNHDGASVLHVHRDGVAVALPPVPVGHIGNLTISHDGHVLAFFLNTPTRPAEIAVVDMERRTLRLLTESRSAALRVERTIAPELVGYPTFDGRTIPAYLYRPHGPAPSPLVLAIHGGPEAQERPIYSSLVQCWLSMGIGVLAPNIRGSTGYGMSYQRLINHDWGGGDLLDLDHAARYLTGLPWVDSTRIGLFGQSYGGFAVLSCLSRLSHPWAAGVSVVGPTNLVTLTRSVPATWLPVVAQQIGDPETERDFLLERSPVSYVDRITAPLFVVQGANDPRVTRAESDQLVHQLRAMGVDVRYDVYEGEGHVFTNRDNQTRVLSDIARFLGDHLVDRTPTVRLPTADSA